MNVSSLSSASVASQDSHPRPFQVLASALKNGDLAGAQKAFSDMQAKFQARKSKSGGDSDGDNDGSKKADANFQALQSALASGDLAGAQKAFQAMGQTHGHHHHHGQAPAQAPASPNNDSAPSFPTGSATVDLSA